MALAERATLVAELRLDDKMSGGLAKAGRGLSKFEGVASRTGKGLKTLGTNLAKIGAGAAVAGAALLGVAIKAGIAALEESEVAAAQTAAVLKSTGGAAKVTAADIDALTASLQAKTATEDDVIRAGANMMLTFTNVRNEAGKGNDIFDQSIAVLGDMSRALGGDMSKSAIQLGKALNDPIAGIGALKKVGVTFDAQQIKRIKAFVKEGEVTKAQAIILAELNKEFGGSGAAYAKTYAGTMEGLAFAVEDAEKALAKGFMPVISKVSKFLQTQLARPEVTKGIEDLGTGLAAAFEGAMDFAMQIPWDAVMGAARGIAGFAKQALTLFNQMPDWAKQILIGGFVANKLSGGLIKDLASGLIKGVLGMTAGVVNVTGGVVNVPGGGLPGGGKGGAPLAAGGFALSSLLPAAAIGGVGAAAVGASLWLQEEGRKRKERGDAPETSAGLAASGRADLAAWAAVAEGTRTVMNTGKPTGGGRGDASTAAEVKRLGDKQALAARIVAAGGVASAARIQFIMDKNARTTIAANAQRLATLTDATRSGLESVTSAANATTAAVNKFAGFTIPAPVVTVTVTGFTVRTLNRKTTVDKSINPVRPEGRGPLP